MSVAESRTSDSPEARTYDEQVFNYHPIPVLVPISLGFVFLSFSGLMLAELLVVPAIGAGLGFIAMRQIQASHGALSGGRLSLIAMVTQLVMLFAFAAIHAYTFATEVPPGYERVNFTADISKKGFVIEDGLPAIHPDIKKLSTKKVMIKGYMYPTKEERGLRSFVLCRDSGQCCFGGQPKATDMILVHMAAGKVANFRQGLVAVAGEFWAEPAVDATGLQPIYQLKCDYFGMAKTWY